jgi:hypothetical protein
LRFLDLHTNHFNGALPPELGQIGSSLTITSTAGTPPPGVYFDLSGNHFEGRIPAALGQNPNLMGLQLSGNQLEGVVPAEVTEHPFYRLDLNYNQLTSPKTGWLDWCSTQTIPPTNVSISQSGDTILLTWTPIEYTSERWDYGEGGYYEISYAAAPFGPFVVHGRTASKTANEYAVTGLDPDQAYCFRLRTRSYAHTYYDYGMDWDIFNHPYVQPNNLWSDYTPVVCVNSPDATGGRTFLPFVAR